MTSSREGLKVKKKKNIVLFTQVKTQTQIG